LLFFNTMFDWLFLSCILICVTNAQVFFVNDRNEKFLIWSLFEILLSYWKLKNKWEHYQSPHCLWLLYLRHFFMWCEWDYLLFQYIRWNFCLIQSLFKNLISLITSLLLILGLSFYRKFTGKSVKMFYRFALGKLVLVNFGKY
jgi:hypothetical protein